VAGFASPGLDLENDAQIAKSLFTAFGAIPAAPMKMGVAKTDNSQAHASGGSGDHSNFAGDLFILLL